MSEAVSAIAPAYHIARQIAHGGNMRKVQRFVNAGRKLAKHGTLIPSTPMNLIRGQTLARTMAGKLIIKHRRPSIADRGGARDLLFPAANLLKGRVKKF